MSFRVGDTTFNAQGRPGIVTERNPLTKEIKVSQEQALVAKNQRHGYINGLSTEQREAFNKVMDNVREEPDPLKRVEELQARIKELDDDPRNFVVSRYLSSEVAHIMSMANITPKTYTVEEDRVRGV